MKKIDIDALKNAGFSAGDLMFAASINKVGVTMTKVIAKFNSDYDSGKIDGFPDSAISTLESVYGNKAVKKMKRQTLIKKVTYLQRCLDGNTDADFIAESVDDYLS